MRYDVIIVGSGPAGIAAALHLCRRDPAWAGRMLVIDKATHPREKLCGGGITHFGEEALADLDLRVDVAFVPVREVRLVYRDRAYHLRANPAFRIVRRDEFDHYLVRVARARGVVVQEGEELRELHVNPGQGVELRTDRGTYRARVLVAADGSKSATRRLAGFDDDLRPGLARLVEVLTPEDATRNAEFRDRRAIFDFSRMTDGLQGYYWDFPSYVQGAACMNRGLFDSRAHPRRPRADLKTTLRAALAARDRDLNDYILKGHPIRCFDPRAPLARPHILLVGDAAGADPLFGEGISFALAYGGPAAEAIADAFARDDFRFADYGQRLMRRPIFRHLRLRVRLARIAYRIRSPRLVRFCWRVAACVVRFTPWRSADYVPFE